MRVARRNAESRFSIRRSAPTKPMTGGRELTSKRGVESSTSGGGTTVDGSPGALLSSSARSFSERTKPRSMVWVARRRRRRLRARPCSACRMLIGPLAASTARERRCSLTSWNMQVVAAFGASFRISGARCPYSSHCRSTRSAEESSRRTERSMSRSARRYQGASAGAREGSSRSPR